MRLTSLNNQGGGKIKFTAQSGSTSEIIKKIEAEEVKFKFTVDSKPGVQVGYTLGSFDASGGAISVELTYPEGTSADYDVTSSLSNLYIELGYA